MDSYLTIFEDRSNGGTKFESVQSRFDRLHISRKNVPWILCDFCGNLVNKILYDSHIIQHDFIDFTYSLVHTEMADERKMLKNSQRIQRKEKRRQRKRLSLIGLDVEEETDLSSLSSSSSSSSSSDGSSSSDDSSDPTSGDDEKRDHSLPGCSNAIGGQPQKRKKVERKVMAVKKEQKVEEEKEQKRKGGPVKQRKKRKATASSAINGVVKEENAEQYHLQQGQRISGTWAEGDKLPPKTVKREQCVTVASASEGAARAKPKQKQKAEIVEQTEEEDNRRKREAENRERTRRNREANRKRRYRAQREIELMRRHLGQNYHRVFVDNSAAFGAFFDRRTGSVSLDSLRLPPQQLRRSRRGATDDGELQCLF